jgi:putative transposase
MLTEPDRAMLEQVGAGGVRLARDVRRARILLLSDAGHSRSEICALLTVSASTVDQTRHRARDEGVAAAITDRPRTGRPPKRTARDEARIVALARTRPPAGAHRWDHRGLTDALLAKRRLSQPLGRETVRLTLKRHGVTPWKKGRRGASRT